MKSMTLILLAAIFTANAAFAADAQSFSASKESQVFEETPSVAAAEPSNSVPTGLDLSNIPEHLRFLVLYAWMLTHKTIVMK